MKKILFLGCVFMSTLVFSQVLLQESFEEMNLGDVTTDVFSIAPGQNGWFALSYDTQSGSPSGGVEDYQVIDGGSRGHVLKITSSGDSTGIRIMHKEVDWYNRRAGNDIAHFSIYFNTGGSSVSRNTGGFNLLDSDFDKNLCGFVFDSHTKIVYGVAYYSGSLGLNHYAFNLGRGGAPMRLPDNTWVKINGWYNKDTGRVGWEVEGYGSLFVIGAGVGRDVGTGFFLAKGEPGNTQGFDHLFDDLQIDATNEIVLSTTNEEVPTQEDLQIYPNPVQKLLTLENKDHKKIEGVEVYDGSGKKIDTKLEGQKIDVTNLPKGTYILLVKCGGKVYTKKFIKN